MLEFFFRAEHKFDKEAFEQSGSNVTVGLVVVLPLFVYFFDLTLFCREKGGLDIVIDEVRINVPEQIGAGSASNY